MFLDKIKILPELKNFYDNVYDYYIQGKNNSIFETLLKINEFFETQTEKNQLPQDTHEVYSFTMQMLGDYYLTVLDGFKGIRFFREKIIKLRQQQLNNQEIIFNIYIKSGELYAETGNKSKASECLSLCVAFAATKEKGYGSLYIEYLSAQILLLLDRKTEAVQNIIRLIETGEELDLIFFYYKNRMLEK